VPALKGIGTHARSVENVSSTRKDEEKGAHMSPALENCLGAGILAVQTWAKNPKEDGKVVI